MYVPESDTEVLEICRLPLGSTVKLPPDTQQKCDDVRFPDTHTHTHGLVLLPVVDIVMPSFCQLIVGLGEPVALQGKVMGLCRITSRVEGWDLITGTSNDINIKNVHFISNCFKLISC